VLQFSFGTDGIELGPNIVSRTQHPEPALFSNLLLYHRWHGENTLSALSERSEQGIIFKLAEDHGPNPFRLKPEIEVSPQSGIVGGQQHRCSIETLREPTMLMCRGFTAGEKYYSALSQ
jgi:hypothetical protein